MKWIALAVAFAALSLAGCDTPTGTATTTETKKEPIALDVRRILGHPRTEAEAKIAGKAVRTTDIKPGNELAPDGGKSTIYAVGNNSVEVYYTKDTAIAIEINGWKDGLSFEDPQTLFARFEVPYPGPPDKSGSDFKKWTLPSPNVWITKQGDHVGRIRFWLVP